MKKGSKQTASAKKKMSLFQKERFRNKENHPQFGCKHTEERCKKQSETMKKKFPPGPTHFNYGSKRSKEAKEKMSAAKLGKYRGKNNHNWKGGKFKHMLGYICVMSFYHPYKNKRGYIFEHRLVIEEQIKRFLKPEEACHHINKIKDDNRPENLMAFKTQGAHNSFEAGNPIDSADIIFDGHNFHIKVS